MRCRVRHASPPRIRPDVREGLACQRLNPPEPPLFANKTMRSPGANPLTRPSIKSMRMELPLPPEGPG